MASAQRPNTARHLVVQSSQLIWSNFVPVLLNALSEDLKGLRRIIVQFSHDPAPYGFYQVHIRRVCRPLHQLEGLISQPSRRSSTCVRGCVVLLEHEVGLGVIEYVPSRGQKVVSQYVDVTVLVHVPCDLHEMSSTTKANTPPEHDTLSRGGTTIQSAARLKSLVWTSPYIRSSVTLADRDPELITEDFATPVVSHGPGLYHPRPSHPVSASIHTCHRFPLGNTSTEVSSKKSESKESNRT